MKALNHNKVKELIGISYDKKLPLYIWGTFGIGKSTIVREVAKNLKIGFIDVRLTQLEPCDLRGLPTVKGDTTKWVVPNWLPRDKDSKGILFLDELNLVVPSIQASCYQLILDRKLGDYELPNGWVVLSAGNRLEDKANVFDLPTPLANRFIHIELNTPTVKDWSEWAFKQDIDNRILAFLNFKPSRLFYFDDKINDRAIPTPRSWFFCSKLIKEVTNTEMLDTLISSSVGEATATEFMAFIKLSRKVDIKEIINNPTKVKEIEEIDLKYSLMSGITEYYKQNKKKEVLQKILRVCKNLNAEFSVLLLRFIKSVDVEFMSKNIKGIPEFKDITKAYGKYIL